MFLLRKKVGCFAPFLRSKSHKFPSCGGVPGGQSVDKFEISGSRRPPGGWCGTPHSKRNTLVLALSPS